MASFLPRGSFAWLQLRSLLVVALLGLGGVIAHAQTPVLRTLRSTGPNANRVNVAILGDGYTAAQEAQFFSDAESKLTVLVNDEAFAPFKDLINGYAVFTASNESGTDIASEGTLRDTYYSTGFSGSINSRLLTLATAAGQARAQDVLRTHVPDYDIAFVMVNTTVYGGAGGTPTVFSLNSSSNEIMLHETGHAFARLADEYVDEASAPSYPPKESINATQKTARTEIPWRAFLLDSTPVPTVTPSTNVNFVGHWEGAYYRTTGFYRPTYDSKMRSLGRGWGPVNLRAFSDAVHRLNLNGATAVPHTLAVQADSARASAGGQLSCTVTAEGTGPLTYQWSLNGKYLATQTQPTLTLTGVSAASVGTYSVEVTNTLGSVTSTNAGISVQVTTPDSGATYELQAASQAVVRWAATSYYVSEQAGAAVLTVTLAGKPSGPFSVPYTTTPGTATAGTDYTARSGTITWPAGDTASKTITIPIAADTTTEGLETFTVTLGPVSNGIIADSATATVSIGDSGRRDPGFQADFINNTVNRIAQQADGALVVAGPFSSVQDGAGSTFNFGRVARLRSDGSLEPTFAPGTGANNNIRALALQPDGKILIGGEFTSVNGTTRNRIARLLANGALDTTFDPGAGADSTVYDLLPLSDGKVLVAGGFTTMGGTAREYLARLNSDGSLDSSFTGPDFGSTSGWRVRSLALQSDGRIVAGGTFYFSGANQRAGLCRLNANGSLDSTFSGIVQGADLSYTAPFLGELTKVVLQSDGKILIGGNFVTYNQASRRGIARVASDGSLDTTFDPGTGTELAVDALAVQSDGKVVIGGTFTTVNGTAVSRLARLNANGSLDTAFAAAGGFSTGVNTLVVLSDGDILLGGSVGSLQGASPTRPVWRILSGPPSAPVITSALTASAGQNSTFSFSIAAANSPTTFGATNLPAGLSIDSTTGIISGRATAAGTTSVTVTATNAGGTDTKTLLITVAAVTNPGRLVNLSLLTTLAAAGEDFTMGVVLGGSGTSGTKPILVRAAGPALRALGVPGTLDDPKFDLFSGSTKIGDNDNWGGGTALVNAFTEVGAFAYASADSKDAAIYNAATSPGSYSIRVAGNSGTTGTVIAELYDSTPSSAFTATTLRLINVSILKQVGSGFTVGFVVGGASSRSVLVRAVGPGLSVVGVPTSAVLSDPRLTLFASSSKINENEDWGGTTALTTAFSEVGAFAIPATSKDAALLASLPPGQYTVQVAGPTNATGLVLVEVYEVP